MEKPELNTTELFHKFLEGSCTAAELQLLLNYFSADTVNEALKLQVQRTLEVAEITDTSLQLRIDKIVSDTDKAIASISGPVATKSNVTKYNLVNWRWLSGVAAIFLLITGIYLANREWQFKQALTTMVVPNTEVKVITLPDGSKVTLNAGSILNYPEEFDGNTREVYLEGEGEFEVTRNQKKPFIVHAGKLRTRVLGTSFIIKAYQGNEKIQVTVLSGKVNVLETESGRNVNLIRNEQVVYNSKRDSFDRQKISNVQNATTWKVGRLAFDDVLFAEVAEEFTRKYGKQIILENPAIANCRISIVFNEETPEEIINALSILVNAKFRTETDKIIFYGAGCPAEENTNNN